MKIEEQPPLAPGLDPYIFVSWSKAARVPSLLLGGGFKKDVHLPDLVERLRNLADELVTIQKGMKNG